MAKVVRVAGGGYREVAGSVRAGGRGTGDRRVRCGTGRVELGLLARSFATMQP